MTSGIYSARLGQSALAFRRPKQAHRHAAAAMWPQRLMCHRTLCTLDARHAAGADLHHLHAVSA